MISRMARQDPVDRQIPTAKFLLKESAKEKIRAPEHRNHRPGCFSAPAIQSSRQLARLLSDNRCSCLESTIARFCRELSAVRLRLASSHLEVPSSSTSAFQAHAHIRVCSPCCARAIACCLITLGPERELSTPAREGRIRQFWVGLGFGHFPFAEP